MFLFYCLVFSIEPFFFINRWWSSGFLFKEVWGWEDKSGSLCPRKGWPYRPWLLSETIWMLISYHTYCYATQINCNLCGFICNSQGENPIGDEEDFGLYEVMRKEVRHAVKEIRTELEKVCAFIQLICQFWTHDLYLIIQIYFSLFFFWSYLSCPYHLPCIIMEPSNFRQLANNIVISYLIQVMVKNEPSTIVSGDGVQPKSSEVLQAIAEIRRNYTTELEQACYDYIFKILWLYSFFQWSI